MQAVFQSTPPARGATYLYDRHGSIAAISIHAPREGGDDVKARRAGVQLDFNPRPPRGGRRGDAPVADAYAGISIHAPREGGDLVSTICSPQSSQFQSTPPARGATKRMGPHGARLPFQSTPPARGATRDGGRRLLPPCISIHAPREGGDPLLTALSMSWSQFQSTPPARGATLMMSWNSEPSSIYFNPRPPRGGRP